MSGFFDWIIDRLASEDVIDLYFVLSDLVDIDPTEDELCETAYFDALASQTADNAGDSDIPLGKLVL